MDNKKFLLDRIFSIVAPLLSVLIICVAFLNTATVVDDDLNAICGTTLSELIQNIAYRDGICIFILVAKLVPVFLAFVFLVIQIIFAFKIKKDKHETKNIKKVKYSLKFSIISAIFTSFSLLVFLHALTNLNTLGAIIGFVLPFIPLIAYGFYAIIRSRKNLVVFEVLCDSFLVVSLLLIFASFTIKYNYFAFQPAANDFFLTGTEFRTKYDDAGMMAAYSFIFSVFVLIPYIFLLTAHTPHLRLKEEGYVFITIITIIATFVTIILNVIEMVMVLGLKDSPFVPINLSPIPYILSLIFVILGWTSIYTILIAKGKQL